VVQDVGAPLAVVEMRWWDPFKAPLPTAYLGWRKSCAGMAACQGLEVLVVS
jgi:hypothetical protein